MHHTSKIRLVALIAALAMTWSLAASAEWQPSNDDQLELSVAQAILKAKEKDPGSQAWFDSAAGYAVFPKVGKAGFGVGGARGTGLLIQGDKTLGEVTLTQLTVGFQVGGQVYMEFIFFKDQANLTTFKEGNFEMGAQISAVALTAGASADANYSKGVAVFTIAEGGLMYEASIGGQKFNFKAR
jgi:lipid-binding SYLF domain-containing protein